MRPFPLFVPLIFVIPLLAACSASSESDPMGGLGEACYSDDSCDEPYLCDTLRNVCRDPGADADGDTGTDGDADENPDGDTPVDGDISEIDPDPDDEPDDGACVGVCDPNTDVSSCVDAETVCLCEHNARIERSCEILCSLSFRSSDGCGPKEENGRTTNGCICVDSADGDPEYGEEHGSENEAAFLCSGPCDPETFVAPCLGGDVICHCEETGRLARTNCNDVCAEDPESYFGFCDYDEAEARDTCMCSPYPEGDCRTDWDCVGNRNGPRCAPFEEGWFCGECRSDDECRTITGKDRCLAFTDDGNPPTHHTQCVNTCTITSCGVRNADGNEIGCVEWEPWIGQSVGLCTDLSSSGEDDTCSDGQTGCGGDADNYCMALNIGSFCWAMCTPAAGECGSDALCFAVNDPDTGDLTGGFCLDLDK